MTERCIRCSRPRPAGPTDPRCIKGGSCIWALDSSPSRTQLVLPIEDLMGHRAIAMLKGAANVFQGYQRDGGNGELARRTVTAWIEVDPLTHLYSLVLVQSSPADALDTDQLRRVQGSAPSITARTACTCGWAFPMSFQTETAGVERVLVQCGSCSRWWHLATSETGGWLRARGDTPFELDPLTEQWARLSDAIEKYDAPDDVLGRGEEDPHVRTFTEHDDLARQVIAKAKDLLEAHDALMVKDT